MREETQRFTCTDEEDAGEVYRNVHARYMREDVPHHKETRTY